MIRARRAVFLVGLCLLPLVGGSGARAAEPPGSTAGFAPLISPGTGLFHSHEFRSRLRALPQWTRVMEAAGAELAAMNRCDPLRDSCTAAALSWQKILRESRSLDEMERLKAVNAFFNRWPYRLDVDAFGLNDYWATPQEFLKTSGDCEDFSIAKYFALKQLGTPVDRMRIVILLDTIRNIPHAVLAVRVGNDSYVLDNLSDLVLSHQRYEHYLPQYSVNEQFRWAHIAPGLMH